jgi:CBS domain containing-hemolysin-like protein
MHETGLLRLPLCEPAGGLDNPVGLLHVQELLIALADRTEVPSLTSLARGLDRVPETLLVDELLHRMRRRGVDFVLVVDEHGTTVGGVGLEDIIDVIIGELEDEFDPTVLGEMRREDGALMVSGSAFIYAVGRMLGVKLPDLHQATIGGVVIERLGRVPEVGDVVILDGLQLEVTDVHDGQVDEVRIVPAVGE